MGRNSNFRRGGRRPGGRGNFGHRGGYGGRPGQGHYDEFGEQGAPGFQPGYGMPPGYPAPPPGYPAGGGYPPPPNANYPANYPPNYPPPPPPYPGMQPPPPPADYRYSSPYGAPPANLPENSALWGVPDTTKSDDSYSSESEEQAPKDQYPPKDITNPEEPPSPYGSRKSYNLGEGAAAPPQPPPAFQNYQPPPNYQQQPPAYAPRPGFPPQQENLHYDQGYGQNRGRYNNNRYDRRLAEPQAPVEEHIVQGIVELNKDGSANLRFLRNNMLPGPDDVFVMQQLVRRYDLRDGALVDGPIDPPRRRGQNPGLRDVTKVDGMAPEEAAKLPRFSELTVIDPDFHYELGDSGDTALRVLDLLCPIGRGTRGLIVAPPRTGKTVLLNKVAQAIERLYPDVHLMVLLVDERPEEGTAWKRLIKGDVFLSTLDEGTKHHVALSEAVFRRATRLVECKKDVMILLDSITRMSRAYNAETGNSGRILTGGVDSRTMEKPKRMFGAARNTEGGGALTILGATLVDTGSKMDQVIFEEFKGTGNMELVLSRSLAERRIFPAFDIGLSGTRKEEKLLSPTKLRRIVTLRRVLQKMKPIEAMENLLLKLERTPDNDEFLKHFELSGADM
ncbi:MAG: transcription termination factor Rho [Planctomycetota bacterium]